MAIDTDNEKLALIEWDNIWEPGLPLSPGSLGAEDKQQLIHGYPGILWGGVTPVTNNLILQWDISNTVSASTQLQWDISNSITNSVVLNWDISNLVANSLILQWDISNISNVALEERIMTILTTNRIMTINQTDRVMLINETKRIMDVLKKR